MTTQTNSRKRTPRVALLGAVALGVTLGAFSALPGIAHAVNDMRQAKMQEERHEQRTQRLLERFDLNKDGQITREEVETVHKARFERFDTDKDGVLSPDEFRSMMAERLDEMAQRAFARMDRNEDGRIEPGEMRNPMHMFGRLDANWDGVVTEEELRMARFERKHDGLPPHGKFRDGKFRGEPRGDLPGTRD